MRLRSLVLACICGVVSARCPNCEAFVGDVRVQTLSPTLIRVEPKGPMGFEDRPTFMVVDRSFMGVPILSNNKTSDGAIITTAHYTVVVKTTPNSCGKAPMNGTDASGPKRSDKFPNGASAKDRGACCALCQSDASCFAWVYRDTATAGNDVPGATCWPLAGYEATVAHGQREFGVMNPPVSITVSSLDGKVIYDSLAAPPSNLLHWPSPLANDSYALEDRPRFVVPEWGPQPMPADAHVDPALLESNGYDFRNNVSGDIYVFLLGDDLESWFSSRGEFLQLTGPTPRLPDYAYGTWYTQWTQYTVEQAKSEVAKWDAGDFPIDVWALDMNWRNTTNASKKDQYSCRSQHNSNPGCEDHFYNHPNTLLFPNFTEWFDWLKARGLHTYFNDHPFPVHMQTTPKEIAFRWQGLTEWISKGLSYWWFDHNWEFTMPPPMKAITDAGQWDGLTSQIWGSQVYYETTKKINALNGLAERPIALTRDNGPNWKPGMENKLGSGVPAHHRFPVWWTGDGVPLYASLETMIDESVHDFRPFVHSDCGGHQRSASGNAPNAYMRWTAHCAFGTIHRFHQGEHRPWMYDNQTQDVIRKYLRARYALSPSIIAAGAVVQESGFPPVARCDLLWPEHPEARSNRQYIHLGDTLIAPMDEQETEKAVWIPPGEWQDAWDGSTVTGPKTMNISKPFSQIPMWHRKGGVLITTASKALRIGKQDWSELTLEAFPAHGNSVSLRRLIVDETTTVVTLTTDDSGVHVQIVTPEGGAARAWRLRVHLAPGQRASSSFLDGSELIAATVQHIEPTKECAATFPFEGMGAAPACKAGPVVEMSIPSSAGHHTVDLSLSPSPTFV